MSLKEFMKTPDGLKMSGLTGGVQGFTGTLRNKPYDVGSFRDRLIEAFGGSHDHIGGKETGLYDGQGNTKRGMSDAERSIYDNLVAPAALVPAAPFAMAALLPAPIWQAIAVFLKAAK